MSAGYAGDLDPTRAWELLRDDPAACLVDVRTQPEWGYVGVPDLAELGKRTVLVEWQRFPDGGLNDGFVAELRSHDVPEDAPVVFLCRSGARSVGAARAATAAGFARSFNVLEGFEGGLDERGHRGGTGWRARGLPWRQS